METSLLYDIFLSQGSAVTIWKCPTNSAEICKLYSFGSKMLKVALDDIRYGFELYITGI
jgi:hypothetical protein